MDCTDLRERLSDFQDGALPGAVAEEVSRHLGICGECAEIDRTLGTLRNQLHRLPPLTAPPELLARVREAIARDSRPAQPAAATAPTRTFASRLRIPLQAAAALLLVASVYWYQQQGASGPPASREATVAPPRIASSASPAAAPRPTPSATARKAPAARRPAATPEAEQWASLGRDMRREGVSALPPDTPEPKVRVWSRADLPAAPALRAGTDTERVVPGFPVGRPFAEPSTPTTAGDESRRTASIGTAREILLEVTPENRAGAEERIVAAAREAGGTVERAAQAAPDGGGVRVVLPEQSVPAFLEELARIGTLPADGRADGSGLSARTGAGTVVYTVNLRVR